MSQQPKEAHRVPGRLHAKLAGIPNAQKVNVTGLRKADAHDDGELAANAHHVGP